MLNQSFATNKLIPSLPSVSDKDIPDCVKAGEGHLVHRTPRLSFFSREDPLWEKMKRHMNNGCLM